MKKCDITDSDIHSILDIVKDEAEALEQADGAVIKATPSAWSVRHDDQDYSIDNMNDEELRQSIVEDLLLLHQWERQGKTITFFPEDIKRFVPERTHARVDKALDDPHVRSFLIALSDGQIRIHPHHLQDAMDYCGVWLEGYEPLTDEAVYFANPDAFDAIDDNDNPTNTLGLC